jgi:hypothetical protein
VLRRNATVLLVDAEERCDRLSFRSDGELRRVVDEVNARTADP